MATVVLFRSPFDVGLITQLLGVFSASWRASASVRHLTGVTPLPRGGVRMRVPHPVTDEVRDGPGHVGPF